MSNSVDLQLVLDNRINVSAETTKIVRISGVQNNFFEINSQGAAGSFASTINFQNVITPSLSNTLVSRNIRLRYQVAVSAAATPPVLAPSAALAANGATAVLRAFPLQSCCDNISVILNGATTTLNARQTISAIQRSLPKEWLMKEGTECPCMPDNSAVLCADVSATRPSSNQPLSSYYNSTGATRASFLPVTYSNGTQTVTYDVSESLLISPLTYRSEENFLANINTLSVQLNYSQLTDMMSYAGNAPAPNGITVTITNPVLELTYIQVANDIVAIPRMVSYPYENVVFFTKSIGTMTSNVAGGFNAVSDTLRLQALPSLIYVFARPQINLRTGAAGAGVFGSNSWADAFLSFGDTTNAAGVKPNVSINIGNRTGLLQSASAKTLYRMSVRNGYQGTYNDFQNGQGSLLIIDPVSDLGVNLQAGDILPGEAGSVNFQINANYSNLNYVNAQGQLTATTLTALPCELVIVVCYSGVVSITPDNCVFNIGELSEAEVNALLRTAPKEGSMISSEAITPTIQGGGLFSKFKSILGSTARGIGAIAPYAQKVGDFLGEGGVLSGAGLRRRR